MDTTAQNTMIKIKRSAVIKNEHSANCQGKIKTQKSESGSEAIDAKIHNHEAKEMGNIFVVEVVVAKEQHKDEVEEQEHVGVVQKFEDAKHIKGWRGCIKCTAAR